MNGAQHSSATAEAACSECHRAVRRFRNGRPRKVCSFTCSMARSRRLATEIVNGDRAEATRWWLSLHEEQRGAAMAFVRSEPVPINFRGGRQLWAYFNRAAFSCEQRVVSGVR